MKYTILTYLIISSIISFSQTENKNNLLLDPNSFFVTPNPFVDTTNIYFTLTNVDTVSLMIYDMWGNQISNIIDNEILQQGQHYYKYVNDSLPSNNYYLFLIINSEHFNKPLLKRDSINYISDISKTNNLNIYPNPAKDYINIKFTDKSQKEISIINETGQVIFKKECFETETKIKTSSFNSGIYFIIVKNKNKIGTSKFIIK